MLPVTKIMSSSPAKIAADTGTDVVARAGAATARAFIGDGAGPRTDQSMATVPPSYLYKQPWVMGRNVAVSQRIMKQRSEYKCRGGVDSRLTLEISMRSAALVIFEGKQAHVWIGGTLLNISYNS